MVGRKNNYLEFLGIAIVLLSIWSTTLFAQFSLNLNFYKFFNMTYLLIYFFTFNNYKYFSFFSMFILGLITDSISGIPFGTSSLAYMTIYKIAFFQETILRSGRRWRNARPLCGIPCPTRGDIA